MVFRLLPKSGNGLSKRISSNLRLAVTYAAAFHRVGWLGVEDISEAISFWGGQFETLDNQADNLGVKLMHKGVIPHTDWLGPSEQTKVRNNFLYQRTKKDIVDPLLSTGGDIDNLSENDERKVYAVLGYYRPLEGDLTINRDGFVTHKMGFGWQSDRRAAEQLSDRLSKLGYDIRPMGRAIWDLTQTESYMIGRGLVHKNTNLVATEAVEHRGTVRYPYGAISVGGLVVVGLDDGIDPERGAQLVMVGGHL